MRRLMISGVALAAVLGPAVGPSAAVPSATPRTVPHVASEGGGFNSCGYYVTTTVHLRTGPGTRYTSVGLLAKDDWVSADKASGGWYRVTLRDTSRNGIKWGRGGWVAKKYLRAAVCTRLNG